jgi:hypothetical protein
MRKCEKIVRFGGRVPFDFMKKNCISVGDIAG